MQIDLVGTFAVRGRDGEDRTPRGAKARALIGILALTSDFRRSRRWVEARLWSDRGERQARRSLRQALSEIRKALGPDRAIIGADREHVWLCPDRIRIDAVHDAAGTHAKLAAGRDLLEGLSVRDREFEHWLHGERAAVGHATDPRERRVPRGVADPAARVTCLLIVRSDRVLDARESAAVQMCSAFLAGYFDIRVQIDDPSRPGDGPITGGRPPQATRPE